MLTNDDIQKLVKVFATKEELEALEARLNQRFDSLMSAVDSYTKKADAYFQEMVMMSRTP